MADYELPDNAIEKGTPAEQEVGEQENYFATGKAAQHPYGVLYQGNWETPFDGLAVAVRKHARALSLSGIPVVLKSFDNIVVSSEGIAEPAPAVGIPAEVKREIGKLNLTSVGSVFPVIKHLVVSDALRLSQVLMRGLTGPADNSEFRIGAQQASSRSTILYSVWERDRIHPDIALRLRTLGECWVPCEQNKKLLQDAGVERVHVVPHPYRPEEDICKLTRRPPLGEGAPKRFYSIGAWQPRKGFARLLEAFLSIFGPKDNAYLTIKYSGGEWPGYVTPEEALRTFVNGVGRQRGWRAENVESRVTLIGKRIPRSRIVELHLRNNIYVCSSHGEAWCLPAFDAKLAGNRLVTIPYGGTEDFMTRDDIAVPYKMGDVHTSYNWEPGAQWAEYDTQELARALKIATAPSEFQRPPYEGTFSEAAVGRLMRERVIEFSKTAHPQAAAYYEGRDAASPGI